jgi:hypothetical protein
MIAPRALEPKGLFAGCDVMIEAIMYMGIGFLFAALIGVAVMPLIHGRAVRLTTRRLEAALPQQMSEIQADKNALRADFAMGTRRLETIIEKLRTKNASQLIEIDKKSDSINRLTLEFNTLKVAAAKVVATYAGRGPIHLATKQLAPENTRRRDGDVTRLLSVLAQRKSGDRRSRVSEPSRRAS